MKNKRKSCSRIIVILTLAISAFLTAAVNAAGAGTTDDPLVTLSYINGEYREQLLISLMDSIDEKYFEQLRAELSGKLYDEALSDIKTAIADGSITVVENEDTASGASDYEVVRLESGQSLTALGACEIILRSGNAVAFVDSEANISAGVGLSDCTDGSEITNNENIPQKHLLVISRADGRGAIVTSGEAYFMVRGDYETSD